MEDTVSDDERNDDEDVSGMPVCIFCMPLCEIIRLSIRV